MRPWPSSPIALVILLSTLRANANPSARLVYVRGPGADRCPNEDVVRTSVAARIGYDPFFLAAPTTIFVEVSREGDRFAALVKLIDNQGVERGMRHLATHSPDCADLIGTLALTISLVIDPVSLATAPIRTDSSAVAPSPPSTPVAPVVVTPVPTGAVPVLVPIAPATAPEAPRSSPSADGASFFAGVSVLGSLGSALAPTAGAVAFGGARWRWVSLRIEARGDLPASARTPPPARSWTVAASAVPCAYWHTAFACAALGVESIQATGDAAAPRNAETLVAVAGGRLGVEIAATEGFAFAAFAEGLVPLQRPRIEIDGVTVHHFSPVAGDVGLSGLARF
jgi:hypothetical protein